MFRRLRLVLTGLLVVVVASAVRAASSDDELDIVVICVCDRPLQITRGNDVDRRIEFNNAVAVTTGTRAANKLVRGVIREVRSRPANHQEEGIILVGLLFYVAGRGGRNIALNFATVGAIVRTNRLGCAARLLRLEDHASGSFL